ncbi:cysteine hydrolase [Burkholderia dolosa]|uniref:Cysteine hydrolase n=1 Tax=Burkholderia dolosa TaxID=152500 RepID=A0A892I3T8_9BURK|nr:MULTISPECIES: cysteine hydrolase family protein [Burkholderia]AKE06161.1 cysteine hydrolase [Burkholderia cepacia]AJY10824.1 isochorismatase family protein [Burkholderia dolosa AU0158]AYZ95153.1 cysteine hydrolase [Burkholderia dolosa]EAY70767.1 Isochorismatase hydrolase [Burkholderia dolosa AU0158]ETP62778.1 cysteine hydrolase [Burkholderia dolosa PC543]
MQHPTIRTLAGATPPKTIAAARTALLVIDFQNEYFGGRLPIPDGARALRNAQRVIAFADRARMPVFHVQHVGAVDGPLFAEGSENHRFHPDLQPAQHHAVVRKTSVSVFPTTDIHARLQAAGIDTLIVTGLMTHACVAGAARDAVPLGYSVIVVDDACATRDLDLGDGDTVSHRDLHRATLAALSDTFGDVLTTEQLLTLAVD